MVAREIRTTQRDGVQATHQGRVDWCRSDAVAGWGVHQGEPARLVVLVNGQRTAELQCGIARAGFAELGLPVGSGFFHPFDPRLRARDLVEVRHEDGVPLINSPISPEPTSLDLLLDGIAAPASGLLIGQLPAPGLAGLDLTVDAVGLEAFQASRRRREADAPIHDFCLAPDVLQRVPDPLGLLGGIAARLRPGAPLALSVPEMTRGAGRNRQETTAGQVLDAFDRRLVRPSLQQVFDWATLATPGGTPDGARQAYTLARELGWKAREPDGLHCHAWSASGFATCFGTAIGLDLVPLRLQAVNDPLPGEADFVARFVRI
jgi:hypothetical protein